MSLSEGVDITNNLLIKDSRTAIVRDRIQSSISKGYFLEAITMEESIISDRLALYLYHKRVKPKSKSLHQLLLSVRAENNNVLFAEIDD